MPQAKILHATKSLREQTNQQTKTHLSHFRQEKVEEWDRCLFTASMSSQAGTSEDHNAQDWPKADQMSTRKQKKKKKKRKEKLTDTDGMEEIKIKS